MDSQGSLRWLGSLQSLQVIAPTALLRLNDLGIDTSRSVMTSQVPTTPNPRRNSGGAPHHPGYPPGQHEPEARSTDSWLGPQPQVRRTKPPRRSPTTSRLTRNGAPIASVGSTDSLSRNSSGPRRSRPRNGDRSLKVDRGPPTRPCFSADPHYCSDFSE